MEIFSAGTSGSSAESFFTRLEGARVTSIVDTRLHNTSQLAAFAKYPDIVFFSRRLLNVPYFHEVALAPEGHLLKAYRAKEISWDHYEKRYLELLEHRSVARNLSVEKWGDRPILICSEHIADHCHRRLAANYLMENLGAGTVTGVLHL